MSLRVRAIADVTADDVVEATRDNDEVFTFIVQIDECVADWHLTLKLYEYFAKEKARHDEARASEAVRK